MNPEQKYIIRGGSNPRGPFTVAELRKFFEQGLITADAECWRDGLKAWLPVAAVVGTRIQHNSRPASASAKAQLLTASGTTAKPDAESDSTIAVEQGASDTTIPESFKYPTKLCLLTLGVLVALISLMHLLAPDQRTGTPVLFALAPAFAFIFLPLSKTLFYDMPSAILRAHRAKTLAQFPREDGIIPLVGGVVLILAGAVLSWLTFARVQGKGGLYVVFTGAIFGGLVLAARGLGIMLTGSPQVGTLLVIYGIIGGIVGLVFGWF